MVRFAIAFAFALPLFVPQDPAPATLDQLLDRMDAAAAGARGSTFTLKGEESALLMAMFMPVSPAMKVSVAKDGTLRLVTEATTHDPRMAMMGGRSTPSRTTILDADGLTLIEERPARETGGQLRRRTEKIAAASVDHSDPFAEASPWGGSMSETAGPVIHLLSPKRAFTFERGIELVGKRRIGAEEFYVIVCRRKIGDPEAAPDPAMPAATAQVAIVKKFYVSAADFRIRRIEERSASGEMFGDMRTVWKVDSYQGAVPSKLTVTISSFGEDYAFTLGFVAADIKAGQEIPGDSLRAPAGDIYATRARDPKLAKLLEKSPDDADLNWSLAVSKGASVTPMMMAMGRGPDAEGAFAAVEKALEKQWAPTLVTNLLAMYEERKANDKLAALVERVEKDEKRTPSLTLAAAQAWNALGKHDRVIALLEKLEGVPRTRIAEERIFAWLSKGDLAKAMAEFAAVAETGWVERLVTLQSQLPDEAKKAIKTDDFLKALDDAVAAQPKSAPFHLARLRALQESADVSRLAGAVKAAFEQSDDKVLHDAAFKSLEDLLGQQEAVGPAIVVPGAPAAKAKTDPEKVKAAIKDIVAALDAAGARPAAAVLRGKARKMVDEKESAVKEFSAALDLAAKAAPGEAQAIASRVCAELEGMGEEALLEKSCRLFLDTIRKNGLGFEDMAMFGMGRGKNPMAIYGRLMIGAKRHAELYHAIKCVDLGFMGLPIFFMMELQGEGLKEFLAAAKEEAFKDSKDVAGLKWLARTSAGNIMFGMGDQTGLDPIELWEKAREWAPKDLESLQALADLYSSKSMKDKSVKACEEVSAGIDGGATCANPWSRGRALIEIADQQEKGAETGAAKATLAKIDLATSDLQPWELWKAGALLDKLGQADKAVAFIARTADEGFRPYLKLAQLHWKREDWMETMRNLNRALAVGFDREIGKPEGMMAQMRIGMGPDPQPAEKQVMPETLRQELLKKLGQDWFIDRLLESKLPAMSAEEEKLSKESFAKLTSEELGERDDAVVALKKLGSRCAAVLKPGLQSGDDEVRLRVRTLLTEWAEPR